MGPNLGGVSMAKSDGAKLVESMEAWIASYMVLPEGFALVAAMWALMSWTFERFDTIPYLTVTAAVKRAGKTQFSELIARLCLNPKPFAAMTGPTFYRSLGAVGGRMSIFFDEAEGLSSESAGVMRSVLNVGFRQGQTIPRCVGKEVVEFPVFCPKCFVLIGDTFDTLKDRSIILTLQRGKPGRDYVRATADGEAKPLVAEIRRVLAEVPSVEALRPEFLEGRDRDIWGALFGLAASLGLEKPMVDRLTRAAADLSALKTAAKRVVVAESETALVEAQYAERALRDLRRVLKASERTVFTADVVARLRDLPDGPWRGFKGEAGLDAIGLAGLLSRFGVKPTTVKIRGVVLKGYKAAEIEGAAAKL